MGLMAIVMILPTAQDVGGSMLILMGRVSQPVELPEPERVGLLTRMAFLGHDTYQARPIRRGLLIREMLLCDPILHLKIVTLFSHQAYGQMHE